MAAEKKKILFILQLPPPVHGVSTMNSYVVNSKLIQTYFLTEVVNLQFATSIKELTKFSFRKILKAIFYGFKILIKTLTFRPNLVYLTLVPTGYAFYRDIFYVLSLKLLNRKIIFHLHGKGILKNASRSRLIKYIYNWIFKNTYVICLSQSLVADLAGIYNSAPFIIPNGIPPQPHIYIKETNRANELVPQILYLSNFIQNKGVLILIKALSIINSKGYKFGARLVGAPSDFTIEMLENIINDEKLTQFIKVIGPLYGQEKIQEFQNADIFVFPTYNDVFGLVNLEAMQFKLPVISTFEGSIPDIVIDNETGFLVEPKNPEMLSNKIAILLKDKDLRIKMGNKGYVRFMNNYTLEHFENNINKTFQTILGT